MTRLILWTAALALCGCVCQPTPRYPYLGVDVNHQWFLEPGEQPYLKQLQEHVRESRRDAASDAGAENETMMFDITGSLFFRGTSQTHKGKKVKMVIGVIAVPDDFEPKDEHFYAVTGGDGALYICMDGRPLSKDFQGYRADQLLCAPLWRV